ncbi:MAG: hypothetical protein IJS60_02700 [Abditibacteriota bacterium]|nr:hypothetical protein [Abditibacteriota bacterium]
MKILIISIFLIFVFSSLVSALEGTFCYDSNKIGLSSKTPLDKLDYTIRDSAGNIVQTGVLIGGKTTKPSYVTPEGESDIVYVATIDIEYKKGSYSLKVGDETCTISIEDMPDWYGNKIGVTDESWCPKPWTPIKVDKKEISVTERTYSLNKFGLFDSVISKGDNILSKPINWVAMVNGKEEKWTSQKLDIVSEKPGCVHWVASLTGASLNMEVKGKCEFDGYCEIETVFTPTKEITVDSLKLNIPYKNEFATLFHYFPKVPVWYAGVNVTKLNAGSVPESWSSDHLPFVWIGNEDKGMQWLCETDEFWKLSDLNKALQINKNDKETVFTLNIIDTPYKIKDKISYTFSFQASPVKPKDNKKYKTHYTYEGGLFDAAKNLTLDNYNYLNMKGYKDYGVNTLTVFTWNEALGKPTPTIPDNGILAKTVRELTKVRDMKYLLFQVFLVSNHLPEYKYFDEVKIMDKNAYYTPGFWENDTVYAVCQNSMWQDYWIKGVTENMDNLDLDGIYTDSVPTIGYCANLNHGCGYIDEEGNVKPTCRYISVRELIKRLYKVLEERREKKEMLFVGHTSASVYLSAISFCDFYLDTEHMMPIKRPFRVPLDAFRAEFMGGNFGVSSQCFSYENVSVHKEQNLGVWRDEMFALGLLHDSDYTHDHELSTYRWQAEDDFGMDDVTFLPYWKDNGWASPEGVYVSGYKKPNSDDMLVYVANFTEENITGTVNLGKPIDSFKGYYNTDNTKLENGNLVDTFEPWKAKIYIIKP